MTVQGLTLGHGARTLETYGGPKRFMGGLIELVKYLKEITPRCTSRHRVKCMGLYDVIKEYFMHKSLDSQWKRKRNRLVTAGNLFQFNVIISLDN